MNKLSLILLMSLATAGAYAAQGTSGGITTSTDPARAAAVEMHAQDIQARQAKEATREMLVKKATRAQKARKASRDRWDRPAKPGSEASRAFPANQDSEASAGIPASGVKPGHPERSYHPTPGSKGYITKAS